MNWPVGIPVSLEGTPFTRIGSYEIHGVVGRGGMATVYACRDSRGGQKLALKLLHTHLAQDGSAISRFQREIRALNRIAHPNVVRVLDVGEHWGAPYFVMPFIEGDDLDDYIRQMHPLALADIVECLLPAFDAIASAHHIGIIHRDLKPSNIRISRNREALTPTVLDFGIAKFLRDEGAPDLTESATAVGTVSYMSPEQLRAAKYADARSDVYSLGAVTYQCVTGVRPFRGESTYSLMHSILNGPLLPPTALRPELPDRIDSVLARAMDREPSRRFASVRELACALISVKSESLARAVIRQTSRHDSSHRTAAAVADVQLGTAAADQRELATDMRFEFLHFDGLHVMVWLAGSQAASQTTWTQACNEITTLIRAEPNAISRIRQFVVTDGGAPDVRQRQMIADTFRDVPNRTSVITTSIRTNPIKRGVATAIRWLNPEFRAFDPRDTRRALDHVGIRIANFEPIWQSLLRMQLRMPPTETLGLVAAELGLSLRTFPIHPPAA